jgi:hypothetical protein
MRRKSPEPATNARSLTMGPRLERSKVFDGFPRLLREQALGRKRRHLERQAVRFGGNGGGQFGRQRQGLRDVVALLFLFVLGRDGRNVAGVRIRLLVLGEAASGEQESSNRTAENAREIALRLDTRF